LRRFRGMSQSAVATAMGTSQSAVARIEGAQENITLDTLQRLIVTLKGRFYVSINPQECPVQQKRPWWELVGSPTAGNPWSLVGYATRRSTLGDQLILGLERPLAGATTTALWPVGLLPER